MTLQINTAVVFLCISLALGADLTDFNLVDELFARRALRDIFYKTKDSHRTKQDGATGLWNNLLERNTREVIIDDPDYKNKLKEAAQIEADVEKRLGQPLELIPFDLESENDTIANGTEETLADETTTTMPSSINFTDSNSNDVIVLNDFIRFRRDANGDESESDHDEVEEGNSREPRGAVTEQWLKQPYPVQADNVAAPSIDGFRAPRVHFVTHRMSSESAQSPPAFYPSFDRESRMGDMDRDYSYRTRYYQQPQNYRYHRPADPYHYYDDMRDRRGFYNPHRYDRYGPNRNDQYSYSNRQQRRIIYYTSLPEVVRTPEKFSYYDRYDDRYPSPSDTYKFRKQSPFTVPKSRYEQDMEGTKQTPYPLKVSTDINVREVKNKNPERRIYSESEHRYNYKAPAFQEEEGNNFNGNQ